MVNDPVVPDSSMSLTEKNEKMRIGYSLDPEPETSSMGKNTCLQSDLTEIHRAKMK